MNNREWQRRELKLFDNQKNRFFDTIKEFSDNLEDMDILTQIEWIENGSYGSGACFALQRALKSITPRTNARARIGAVALQAFYGAPFTAWQKLSKAAQDAMNTAVDTWLKQDHNFAMDWIVTDGLKRDCVRNGQGVSHD